MLIVKRNVFIIAMVVLVALFAMSCENQPTNETGIKIDGKEYETLLSALEYFDSVKGTENKNVTINIYDDIDMTGVEWTPFVVDSSHGAGIVTIEAYGHKITNLSAPLFKGGFGGEGGIVIHGLVIADSKISSANTQGIGAFIECVDSMPKVELKNCALVNSSISATGADNASRVGGLIGWTAGYNGEDGPVDTYVTIENCAVTNCEIVGIKGTVGGIIGHAGANPATFTTITNCAIKDTKLGSIDDDDWRVGSVVGTANVGEVTITNAVESGNTLTQTGKEAPEHTLLYGRFVPSNGNGKLTIDGVAITN